PVYTACIGLREIPGADAATLGEAGETWHEQALEEAGWGGWEAHFDHLAVGVEHHGALQPAGDALRDPALRDATVAREHGGVGEEALERRVGRVAMQRV